MNKKRIFFNCKKCKRAFWGEVLVEEQTIKKNRKIFAFCPCCKNKAFPFYYSYWNKFHDTHIRPKLQSLRVFILKRYYFYDCKKCKYFSLSIVYNRPLFFKLDNDKKMKKCEDRPIIGVLSKETIIKGCGCIMKAKRDWLRIRYFFYSRKYKKHYGCYP